MKFDHLGVVASDLAAGRDLLRGALGITQWTREYEETRQDVFVQFGRCRSGICYEIVAPRSPLSPVRSIVARRMNALNHVAYLVDDLAIEAQRLALSGFIAVGDAKPGLVFNGRAVQFFISPARMMFELIEAPDHEHLYGSLAASVLEPIS